jgi:DNA-binding protein Fis
MKRNNVIKVILIGLGLSLLFTQTQANSYQYQKMIREQKKAYCKELVGQITSELFDVSYSNTFDEFNDGVFRVINYKQNTWDANMCSHNVNPFLTRTWFKDSIKKAVKRFLKRHPEYSDHFNDSWKN